MNSTEDYLVINKGLVKDKTQYIINYSTCVCKRCNKEFHFIKTRDDNAIYGYCNNCKPKEKNNKIEWNGNNWTIAKIKVKNVIKHGKKYALWRIVY
jgi:hypothetical protein